MAAPRCVCAAVENRAREVGIAKLDVSAGTLTLYQFIERQRYHTSRGIVASAFAGMAEQPEPGAGDEAAAPARARAGVLILCDSRVQKGNLNLNGCAAAPLR